MGSKIAVLMSTYNGEKYLKEQIESILKQKDVDVTLYIRDDGSKDKTRKIIAGYMKTGKVVLMDDSRNVGPGMSFMLLLVRVGHCGRSYDYYSFADQDDIWMEEKLVKAVEMLKGHHTPALYCSNQTLYQNGKVVGMKFNAPPEISMIRSVSSNDFAGCTMVMNNPLVSVLLKRPMPGKNFLRTRNHDAWVYMIASVEGEVVYDSNSYMLYRLHENNVVGISKIDAPFKDRVKKLFSLESKNVRCRSAYYLLRAYSDETFEGKNYVDLIANYRGSTVKKIKLIKCASVIKNKNENGILYCLKVIVNYI